MKTSGRFAIKAIALWGIVCAASTAAVKVEEQVLLAKSAGAICTVSPTGVHLAAIIAKGSRAAVVYDGVESKRFDAILSPNGSVFMARPSGPPGGQLPSASPVVFSPDGEHYAYAAHDGDDYVVMVDGKELARGRWEESTPALGPFAFSPAGNHFYFGVQSRDTSDPKAGFHLQVDDKVGPTSRYPTTASPDSNDNIVFSPDGAHYAYIGSTTRDQPDVKWAVVDGRQVKYFGDGLRFTAGGHLLSVFSDPGAPGKPPNPPRLPSQSLIIDGKAMVRARYLGGIWVSPKGDQYAVEVTPRDGVPSFLTLNSKPVPGTENTRVTGVYFSPDNKRFAALCTPAGATTGSFILLDGKKGQKYQSIDTSSLTVVPFFSADSSKFVYAANNNGRFLVVNEDESDAGFQQGPFLSPNGARLAYGLMTNNGGSSSVALTLGDKVIFNGFFDRFGFSPDSSRYAFLAAPRPTGGVLHVDDLALSGLNVSEWTIPTRQNTVDRFSYLFSPDSKHITYLGDDPAKETRRGLWIDQTLVFHSPGGYAGNILRPTFSPDSQHLVWLTREVPTAENPQGGFKVYVDGAPSITFTASFFDNYPGGAWEFGADGVLQLLAVTPDGIKRYRITPSPEATVATLIASGGK